MGVEYFDCWADHVDHAMADYREWCLTMKDTGYAGMLDAEVGDIGTAAEDCDAFYVHTHTHTQNRRSAHSSSNCHLSQESVSSYTHTHTHGRTVQK